MPTMRTVFLSTTAVLLAVGVASARDARPTASPSVVQSLLDCRKVAESGDRLACYDKAAAAMESATASGDLVSIDREQRRKARRQAFGFTLPSLAFLDRGDRPEETNRMTATVASANLDATGRWVIQLEGGAVWRQTEVQNLGRDPHKGSTAVISKGALGSYFLTVDGQGAGKAKRES